MSTEHDFEAGSEQHTWIMKDLANINRTKTPWAIFGGHRPFYVDSTWNAPPDGDKYVIVLRCNGPPPWGPCIRAVCG